MCQNLHAQEDTTQVSEENLKTKVEELQGSLEALTESFTETKNTVDLLKKIKISGYIQTQLQSAQSDGIASFAGGNFPAGMHNRLMIRRGRLKILYDNDLTNYVIQIDATEKGLGLKDIYFYAKDPWLKNFAVKAGVFDRPFGFEISYSSSSRETPERSRIFQILFPGERDLGISFESAISDRETIFNYLNFKAGMFAGNGVNPEVDNYKDFIGRLGFSLPFYEQNLALDGGISIYAGKVKVQPGKNLYTLNDSAEAIPNSIESSAARNYYGLDFQLYYTLPVIGSFSIRSEFITGNQAGGSTQNSTSPTSLLTGDVYLRNFTGFYIMYVQNLGESNQLLFKYDSYDPNTDVNGNEIGLNTNNKLGPADIKYTTLGIGLVHYYDDNIKLTCYYDSIANETTQNLNGFKEDIRDNVFTFRIQYKF